MVLFEVGDMPTEMFYHFFKSFSDASASNLNIKAEGTNEHHKIEGIFKAGVWSGIIMVVIVVALIIWLISKFMNRGGGVD